MVKVLSSLLFLLAASTSALVAAPPKSELLGEPVGIIIIQDAAFGNGPNGENQVYFATNGNPATFYAVDAETMKVDFTAPLPGLDVVWAIARASDGNIYFAGTRGGHLFRYNPKSRQIDDLGHNGSRDNWVWDIAASDDGKLYGATYPNAEIFEYDVAAETHRTFASGYTDQKYARGTGVSDTHVYSGVGTTAALFRFDRQSGKPEEIPTPVSGENQFFTTSWIYGGKILVRAGSSQLYVFDEKTLQPIRPGNRQSIAFSYVISPPSPHNPDLIYYKHNSAFYSYDLARNKIEKIPLPTPISTSPMRDWDWIELRHGEKKGRHVLVGLAEFGELFRFDPVDGTMEIHHPEIRPQGVLVQSVEVGPDDRLYIGGYQAGMSVYDPSTQAVVERYPHFNQPEGIGFFDGDVYFGTYGSARIFRLDPEKPRDFGTTPAHNPGLVFSVGHHQDRPFAFAASDDQLFIGTVPGYGSLGGALTVFDRQSGQWEVFPNLIENQSIIGLVWHNGKIYGATSVFGGLGINPSESVAKLFVWDPATKKIVRQWTPEIPGIDPAPKALGGLSVGPDGKLWVAADGAVFVLNPETLEIERSRVIHPTRRDISHYWRPVYFRWAPNGKLFTTLGRQLTVLDPETLESEVWDGSSLMTLHDGYVYYAKGSKLFRRPIDSE